MDIIACILEIAGAWMIGNKDRRGFAVMMCGNACWFEVGDECRLIGLMVVSVVFFGINIRNFRKWRN